MFGGVLAGSTSVSIDILLRKKADNTEKTGAAFGDAGNSASYRRQGAAAVAITLATQTVTGAFSSGGFVEVDATKQPGVYRFDVPDLAFAAGVDYVTITFVSTTGYTYVERIPLSTHVIQSGDSYGVVTDAGFGLAKLVRSTTPANPLTVNGSGKAAATVATGDFADILAVRAAKIDNLDAAITTRSTYAGGAVASVTGSVGSVVGLTASNLDTTVSSRSVFAGGAVASVTGAVGSVTADVGITQAGADKVWGSAARSLTTFGTLVADIAMAVWGAATRVLTAGTNIVLAKGTGVTGFTDVAASAVRIEMDSNSTKLAHLTADVMTAANYTAPDNASLLLVKAKTDNLPASPAAVGSAMTLAVDSVSAAALKTDAVAEIVAAIFANQFSGSWNGVSLDKALKAILAMVAGITAGGGTITEIFKDAAGNVVVTITNNGTDRTVTVLA